MSNEGTYWETFKADLAEAVRGYFAPLLWVWRKLRPLVRRPK